MAAIHCLLALADAARMTAAGATRKHASYASPTYPQALQDAGLDAKWSAEHPVWAADSRGAAPWSPVTADKFVRIVHGRRASWRLSYLALAKPGSFMDDLLECMGACVETIDKQLREEGADLDKQFAQLHHVDASNCKKSKLSELKECTECSCGDYDHHKTGDCLCGHADAQHSHPERPALLLLITLLASVAYPALKHGSPAGLAKTQLCELNVSSGFCYDYNTHVTKSSIEELLPLGPEGEPYNVDPGCRNCGYPASHHLQYQGGIYLDQLILVVVEFLYRSYGHRQRRGDDVMAAKELLTWIKPCTKCACKDFDYSFRIPLLKRDVCKCRCSLRTHKGMLR